jgi:hypothetical protein
MDKAIRGLPSLIGVIAGVKLYTASDFCGWVILSLIFISVFLLMKLGKRLTPKNPRLGMILIELWILSSICIVALSTAFIVWLSIQSSEWFNVPKEEIKIVTGAFIGAITTFFAATWTADISKGNGYFWPTTHLKEAFLSFQLTGDTKFVEAATADRVREGGPKGWGFNSRWQRASILAEYLQLIKRKR